MGTDRPYALFPQRHRDVLWVIFSAGGMAELVDDGGPVADGNCSTCTDNQSDNLV